VVLYTELLCYHPYLVSMLFADLLSLHLITFLMFFILVKSNLHGGTKLGKMAVYN